MVIAVGYEEKESGEEENYDDADSSSRQELEVKVLLTKKPGVASSHNASASIRC